MLHSKGRVGVPRSIAPGWNVLIESALQELETGNEVDERLAEEISTGNRPPTLRIWPVDNGALRWSAMTPPEKLDVGRHPSTLDALAEWPLAALRQLGIQASIRSDGAIYTPLGIVGTAAIETLAKSTNILLASGIIDYAMHESARSEALGDLESLPDPENVRSQSGLPLPLVLDRFLRMARTLFSAETAVGCN